MNLKRFAVRIGASLIPFGIAENAARYFLATQGIGYATDVVDSGEIAAARKVLRSSQHPTIVDVGANVGEFACAMSKLFPAGKIFALEPSASHFKRLSERLSAHTNAYPFHLGLSNEEAVMPLRKEKDITGLATLLRRDLSYLNIDQSYEENVNLVSGHRFCASSGIDCIDYLKIDVEGWELPVLEGLEPLFGKGRIRACQFELTIAQLERHESFRDFWNFFRANGFSLFNIKPNGALRPIQVYEEIQSCYLASNYLAICNRPADIETPPA
jgi:FkbM family methyltransferase